jgi:anaphase-promoting complex subunit 2
MVFSVGPFLRVRGHLYHYIGVLTVLRLGSTISAAYVVHFQTHVFSILPPTFAGGFKALISATLATFTDPESVLTSTSVNDPELWPCFEMLGLTERYEALIASVCYEHIESHVIEACTGKWDEPMLARLREWMADKVVPWMLLPYARGAKTGEFLRPSTSTVCNSTCLAEEARGMLQGVGSRFDFHVCKTLCDLR